MLQEDEVLHADARGMVMMNLYLYMTLPNLMPRTTLEFAGKLGEKRVCSRCMFVLALPVTPGCSLTSLAECEAHLACPVLLKHHGNIASVETSPARAATWRSQQSHDA